MPITQLTDRTPQMPASTQVDATEFDLDVSFIESGDDIDRLRE